MTIPARARPVFAPVPLPHILDQHLEELLFLRMQRPKLLGIMEPTLEEVARHDERSAAHLDGLRVAADAGWAVCEQAMDGDEPGAIFPAAVLALEAGQEAKFAGVLDRVRALPALEDELIAASVWTSPRFLSGTIKSLLDAESAFGRRVAVGCCLGHGVDPGPALHDAIRAGGRLGALGLAAAGALGRVDLLPQCLAGLDAADADLSFHAARAAVLLGDRDAALRRLLAFASVPGRHREQALRLLMAATPLDAGRRLLEDFARDPDPRVAILAGGALGDVRVLPGLIDRMAEPALARVAGLSFCLITGLDLAADALEAPAPVKAGPEAMEEPDDSDIALDADENRPWPDAGRIGDWWRRNANAFQDGRRHFMGRPLDRAACVEALHRGRQSARELAALHLSLLAPGTPVFDTGAPAWRQSRLLSKLK